MMNQALGVASILPGMEIAAAFGPGGLLPLGLLFVLGVGLQRVRAQKANQMERARGPEIPA